MEFNSNNAIVQLCLKGMALEHTDKQNEAHDVFMQAWQEADDDFEKFLASYFLGRNQNTIDDKLKWLEKSLCFAQKSNNEAVSSALPSLYSHIAECYEKLGEQLKAQMAREFSGPQNQITDKGPFYHGTKADLQIGDLLTPGGQSNYQENLVMNHIYFTALSNGAGLAAALAKGEGRERIYIVEPTGTFENDPNVTNKKFPGNLTRSYRTASSLKIVGEIKDWSRQTPQDIKTWREKLSKNNGEIIN
jgi:rifampin ADP-ribosylating transferase